MIGPPCETGAGNNARALLSSGSNQQCPRWRTVVAVVIIQAVVIKALVMLAVDLSTVASG